MERVSERELGSMSGPETASSTMSRRLRNGAAGASSRHSSTSAFGRRHPSSDADGLDRLPHHRRCGRARILREQILEPRHTGHPGAAQASRWSASTSLIAVVVLGARTCVRRRSRQAHDLVPMLNVEHRRQQRFCKGRRRLGILPQDVSRDGRQPRVVRTLQFLEDKRQCSRPAARDGRARAAARRASA